jgi:L-threonylcarbamoyladenylate synthase
MPNTMPYEQAPTTLTTAAAHIRAGGLIAMPTETVYGLAADATNAAAIAALYALKGRPRFNPLIVHIASLTDAENLAEFTPAARALAAAHWPGPLTLILKARTDNQIADLVTAGLDTIAVRVPAHPLALALIAASGRPLAAPSANRSGRVSPTTAAHVAADFGADLPQILEGGATSLGLESTIIDASGPTPVLLRPGSLAAAAIEATLGQRLDRPAPNPSAPSAPGQLHSHYAPRALVRLNAHDIGPNDALLAFGPALQTTNQPTINLSPTGDLNEAAQRLFSALRQLDASGVATIAVMPIPDHGLGEAINDRLTRAAAARP